MEPVDVLVDGMRGPSSIWYRIRINLQHVPEDQRPPQEDLIADYCPWEGYSGAQWRRLIASVCHEFAAQAARDFLAMI